MLFLADLVLVGLWRLLAAWWGRALVSHGEQAGRSSKLKVVHDQLELTRNVNLKTLESSRPARAFKFDFNNLKDDGGRRPGCHRAVPYVTCT